MTEENKHANDEILERPLENKAIRQKSCSTAEREAEMQKVKEQGERRRRTERSTADANE
jgi:hypothetical protein